MNDFTILLLGTIERAEFAEAIGLLSKSAMVVRAADAGDAERRLRTDSRGPDLVVLAASRPGEISHAAVERLRRAAPLVPLVGLLGSQCEGETRSGDPWPGVLRIFWYQAAWRMALELHERAAGRCPLWALPATITDEELALTLSERPLQCGSGCVALGTRWLETASAWADACDQHGHPTYWLQHDASADDAEFSAAIWDVTHCDDHEREELARFHRRHPSTTIVAVMDFPRCDDVRRLRQAGARAVLGRPFFNDELFGALSPGDATVASR